MEWVHGKVLCYTEANDEDLRKEIFNLIVGDEDFISPKLLWNLEQTKKARKSNTSE